MSQYFRFDYTAGDFVPFSLSHFVALGIIVLLNVVMVISLKKIHSKSLDKWFANSLELLLILQEISLSVWRITTDQWRAGTSLPLHLCGAAVVLSAVLLVTKKEQIYEIVYFWGFGGALQALMTPDIGPFSYPHYRFFQFFVSHGAIVTATVYATFILGYRPFFRSIVKVFVITNIYMIFIAVFNYLFDGNYLFICHKPETASLIDYLGPWPYYILSLEVVGLISFLIYYSPFAIRDYVVKIRQTKE